MIAYDKRGVVFALIEGSELLLHDGGVVTFPGVSGGRASWGSTVPGRLAALEGLRLVDGAGAVRYRGTVTGPD